MRRKLKTIANISTIGELRKLLEGFPDDVGITMYNREHCYYERVSMRYLPSSREFAIDTEETESYIRKNGVEVVLTDEGVITPDGTYKF